MIQKIEFEIVQAGKMVKWVYIARFTQRHTPRGISKCAADIVSDVLRVLLGKYRNNLVWEPNDFPTVMLKNEVKFPVWEPNDFPVWGLMDFPV